MQDSSAPVANFNFTPATPKINQPVTFDASASSDDVGIAAYAWSFPDGSVTTTSAAVVQHTFTSGFTGAAVQLTVTDYVGRTNTLGKLISVSADKTVPDPPTNVKATRGDGQAIVTWNAPAFDGGNPILFYTVTSSPSNVTVTTAATVLTSTFTGLVKGVTYTFMVTATNALGTSAPPSSSTGVTFATAPDPPTNVKAVAGNGQAALSWNAPVSNGGDPILFYTVMSSPGGIKVTTTAGVLTATAAGLTNGATYTFTVSAANGVGTSAESSPSNTVTPATKPSAPLGVSAVAGPGQAKVSWSASASDGFSSILFYTLKSFVKSTNAPGPTAKTASGSVFSATVTGLTNGVAYYFKVSATNAIGEGPDSAPFGDTTPATVPNPPTGVTAVPGKGQAVVNWVAPASNGGSAILYSTVRAYFSNGTPTGAALTTTATTVTFTGLTNGTDYFFDVSATNAVGESARSDPSGFVTPAREPDPATGVKATAGNGQASVQWNAPAFDGGSPITKYTVISTPGTITVVVGTTLIATVTGLTNGVSYTFIVAAENAVGPAAPSLPSSSVTPVGFPGAPTSPLATAGNKQATVTWVAPLDTGGSPIVSYTVTSIPDGKTATVNGATLIATVTGLTNGKAGGYRFTVKAKNTLGEGPASAQSNSVTPLAVPGAPTLVTATPGDKQATVKWVAPLDTGGSAIASYTVKVSPGGATVTTADGATTSATVAGLANGTTYTFAVFASNDQGDGPESAPSNPVTPATIPGSPGTPVATPGDSSATVIWSLAVDNGSPITKYVVTSASADPGAATGTATWTFGPLQATIAGLTNGKNYTFTVRAFNVIGSGPLSPQSNTVKPGAAPGTPEVSTPASPTNQHTITLEVTAPLGAAADWKIRITGGKTLVEVPIAVVPGGIQTVPVDLNLTTPGEGEHPNTLVVRVLNNDGVQSAPVTRVVDFDDVKPVAPTVSTPKSPTNKGTATLDVIAETGAVVVVSGGKVQAVGVSLEPGVAVTLTVELKVGANALVVRALDDAGNISDGVLRTVVYDNVKPAVPSVTQPPTPTNSTKTTLLVTAEAGALIDVKGGKTDVLSVGATGVVQSIDVLLNTNASNTLLVTATDAAGNTSDPAQVTVEQDATPPAAPTVSTPPAFTKNPTVDLTITAETGSLVTVTGGQSTVTHTASTFTLTVGLKPNQLNTLTVTAKDAAGNESVGVVKAVTNDGIAPDPPVVSTPPSPTTQTSVLLTVTAEAGATLSVTGGGGDVSATGAGAPQSVVVPLNKGTNTLVAIVTDAAGNASSAVTRTVVVETAAPNPPVVSIPVSPTNSGSVALQVTPPADALGTWFIQVTGGLSTVTSTVTLPIGPQSLTVPLTPDTMNTLSVTVVNEVGASAAVIRGVLQDSKKPNAPVVSTPPSETNASSITLTVNGDEPGLTIQVTGGAETITALASSPVDLVVNLKLDQDNVLSVRAIDAAGNKSTSVTRVVSQDSKAPLLTVDPVSLLTRDSNVTFNLTTEYGATVKAEGGVVSPVTDAGMGSPQLLSVTLATSTPADLVRTISVRAFDVAGNVSPAFAVTIHHDSVAPAKPVVVTPPASTLAPFLALKVTGEKDAVISVSGGASTVSAIATGLQQSVVVPLTANVVNVLTVTVTDGAGNVSLPDTEQIARGPDVTSIRGKLLATASNLAGAFVTVTSTSDGKTSTASIVPDPANAVFTVDKLSPVVQVGSDFVLQAFTVAVTYSNAGVPKTVYYNPTALGNVTVTAPGLPVDPGATGAYLEMSVLAVPVVNSVSGGGDNTALQTITVNGVALDGASEVWLISDKRTVALSIIPGSITSTQVRATSALGIAGGTYNVRVRTPGGLSAPSTGTVVINDVGSLPLVTILSQTVVVQGTSPVITLTGKKLTGATQVIVDPTGDTVAPTVLSDTSLRLTLPATLGAGNYAFQVTTPAGTGPASPAFVIQVTVDVSAATTAQVVSGPISVGTTGLTSEVTLTNEGATTAAGDARAAVKLPAGTQFNDDAGNPVKDSLLPPRQVPLPETSDFPAGAVGMKLGLPDARVNLSTPVVMQVVMQGTVTPTVYLLVTQGPPAKFELAGIVGSVSGINYVPGGTVLQKTSLGGGQSEYLLGVLLDHFSVFVSSSTDLIPNTAPDAPASVSATRGASSGTVVVKWSPPGNDGGAAITSYSVTSSPAGGTGTVSSSACATLVGTTTVKCQGTVGGLTNGIAYQFTVKAQNSVGTGVASALSNLATPATAPSAPTNVTASQSDKSSTLTWQKPADGGSSITGYQITVTPSVAGSPFSLGAKLAYTVTGLANGTAYAFTVTAQNEVGSSPSSSSAIVTPSATGNPPGAPTIGAATPGDGQAIVTWSAPGSSGSSPITAYVITAAPGGKTATWISGALSVTVTGLINGTSYTFTVVAANGDGSSAPSGVSGAATPFGVPGAPTSVSATGGDGQATVAWTAPSANGSAITGFTVTASPGGKTASVAGSAVVATVTGLTNGITYTFSIVATNARGAGPASGASPPVTPLGTGGGGVPPAPTPTPAPSGGGATPKTVPGQPTSVTATASDGQAVVSWSAPNNNGGSAITGYTIIVNPGGREIAGASGVTVKVITDLVNGVAYTFTVKAVNAQGAGSASLPSPAVTPAAPTIAPPTPVTKDVVLAALALKPTIGSGASAKDAGGATVTVSSGATLDVQTRADGKNLVIFPVALTSGGALSQFTDATAGVSLLNNIVTIQLKDSDGQNTVYLEATAKAQSGTGSTAEVEVQDIRLKTVEQKKSIGGDVGTASVTINAGLNKVQLPSSASVTVTVQNAPSAGDAASFTSAAQAANTKISATAYSVKVDKTGLVDKTDISQSFIDMKVGKAFADKYGLSNVKVMRKGDDGKVSTLSTAVVDQNVTDGTYTFRATSPDGLSVFALTAQEQVTATPTPTVVPSVTPAATATPVPPTATATPAPATSTATPTATPKPATPTATPAPIATATPTPLPSATPTSTPTLTVAAPVSPTPTATPTPAPPAPTATPTAGGGGGTVVIIIVVLIAAAAAAVGLTFYMRGRRR